MHLLDALLRERLGIDLREMAGATAAGEIPVREELANRLIADRLRDHPHLAAVRLEPQAGDALVIHVVPRMRLMPPVRVLARLERQPQFPDNPVLLVRWQVPGAGPLAMFAAPVLSYFKTLPPGIAIDGDRVRVDLGALLRDRGLGEALAFIRRAELHTRPGIILLACELAIP